jgi:signal transduction histidine kinase
VAKHADGAGVVRITLRSTARGVEVEVVDDGPGGAAIDAGSGLRGLRDRLEALGGTLAVASRPGGTTLRATLPARTGSTATR